MNTLANICLGDYTTFRIGGLCKKLWFPESDDDVLKIWEYCPNAFDYCLGNGSNLLIDDKLVIENAICTRELNKSIKNLGEGRYLIGAGVTLQQLIKHINKDNRGGIEYLFSVPGTVGGSVVMNAGRGKNYNVAISDCIERVHVFINGDCTVMEKRECSFSYRTSCFQNMNKMIILYVEAAFSEDNIKTCENRIRERMEYVKKKQDLTYPNAGSIFKECNRDIMESIRTGEIEDSPILYSRKTPNWLLNKGGGCYKDAKVKINKVIDLHRIKREPIELELIEWTKNTND